MTTALQDQSSVESRGQEKGESKGQCRPQENPFLDPAYRKLVEERCKADGIEVSWILQTRSFEDVGQ